MASKEYEKWLVEQAMQVCPSLFPLGELIEHERPDLLLKAASETIGIEVTQLFQLSQKRGKFTPQGYDSEVAKVVCLAKERYREMGGTPVNVHVYPTTFGGGKINKSRMADSLACFVKRHYRAGQTTSFSWRSGITVNSHEQCRLVTCNQCIRRCIETPEGFTYGSMFPPSEHLPDDKWWVGSGLVNVPQLNYKDVESTIKQKNEKLAGYRTSTDRVWLLVAIDLFPMSASLEVPRSVEAWSFSSDFDKVLLYSREDTRVFELGPCP